MKTDKDLVTITQTYLMLKQYRPGEIIVLGKPILITANGIPVYQNDHYYTETRKVTGEEAKELYPSKFFN